jgi:flagellar basal-body rod protein FlgB
MGTQDLVLMKAMTEKMDWQEKRQKVLAQNIANADTPNYQPQDLNPINFKDMLGSTASKLPLSAPGLATTNSKHISLGGTSGNVVNTKEKAQKNPYETSPSGNAVVLEEQLLKMNENMTDHQFITNLYQKQVEMMKQSTK